MLAVAELVERDDAHPSETRENPPTLERMRSRNRTQRCVVSFGDRLQEPGARLFQKCGAFGERWGVDRKNRGRCTDFLRPGITSLASVYYRKEGLFLQGIDNRDEFYKETILPIKDVLNRTYAERVSLFLDLRIILLTGFLLFFPGKSRVSKMKWGSLEFSFYSRSAQVIIDFAIPVFCIYAAYWMRYEGNPPAYANAQMMLLVILLPFLRWATNRLSGVYDHVWRLFSLMDGVTLASSSAIMTAILLSMRLFSKTPTEVWPYPKVALSVITIEYLLTVFAKIGVRVLRRAGYEMNSHYRPISKPVMKRILIAGIDQSGVRTLQHLRAYPEYDVVGFVDGDPRSQGRRAEGKRVLGRCGSIPEIAKAYSVDHVVVCFPLDSASVIDRIYDLCGEANISWSAPTNPADLLRGRADSGQKAGVPSDRTSQAERRKRLLLYGAGKTGALICQKLAGRDDLEVVGFVDDDPAKHDLALWGIPVLGTSGEISDLAQREVVDEVVVTISCLDADTLSRIAARCSRIGVGLKCIRNGQEVHEGWPSLAGFQEVPLANSSTIKFEDLEPGAKLRKSLIGRRVLIAGAAGTMGSELARQVAAFAPASLLLLDINENGLAELRQELLALFPGLSVVPLLSDIRAKHWLEKQFAKYRPEVVFQAAAYTHAAMLEWNPGAAVMTNLLGTRNLLDACARADVQRFILLSSDDVESERGIAPATQRLSELLTISDHYGSHTVFKALRFGRTLESSLDVPALERGTRPEGSKSTAERERGRGYPATAQRTTRVILRAACWDEVSGIYALDPKELRQEYGVQRPSEESDVGRIQGLIQAFRLVTKLNPGASDGKGKWLAPGVQKMRLAVPWEGDIPSYVEQSITRCSTGDDKPIKTLLERHARMLAQQPLTAGDTAGRSVMDSRPRADRRRTERVSLDAHATVKSLQGRESHAAVLNISESGVCICAGQKFTEGEVISISFANSSQERAQKVLSRVLWCHAAEGASEWTYGLRFDDATLIRRLLPFANVNVEP